MRTFLVLLQAMLVALVSLPTPAGAVNAPDGRFVVIIDPGHGGGDTGTPRRLGKLHEKDIALRVALSVGRKIKAAHPDVQVAYTRQNDTYPTLPRRVEIARQQKGDLFISIHVNAMPTTSPTHGIETYVFGVTGLKGKSADEQARIRKRAENERENLDITGKVIDFEGTIDIETKILCQTQREKHNIYSQEFARTVQRCLVDTLRRTSYRPHVQDRGVLSKNLFVLCYSPMPAVLIELGYMTNADEEAFMNSSKGQEAYASAISAAFSKYKQAWDKRQLPAGAAQPAAPAEGGHSASGQAAASSPHDSSGDGPGAGQSAAQRGGNRHSSSHQGGQSGTASGSTPAQPASATCYRIQFLTAPTLYSAGSAHFKGLAPVSHYKEGSTYKYVYGKGASPAALQSELKRVKQLFPDAFIVKMDSSGRRVR